VGKTKHFTPFALLLSPSSSNNNLSTPSISKTDVVIIAIFVVATIVSAGVAIHLRMVWLRRGARNSSGSISRYSAESIKSKHESSAPIIYNNPLNE